MLLPTVTPRDSVTGLPPMSTVSSTAKSSKFQSERKRSLVPTQNSCNRSAGVRWLDASRYSRLKRSCALDSLCARACTSSTAPAACRVASSAASS
jgi:hypothetical protein